MSATVVLRMTRSQQMALVDILIAYVRSDDVQSFLDCSNGTETTSGELLSLVASLRELEVTEP